MSTIYLLAFNNYYNRRVLRQQTIEQYQEYVLHSYQDRNFVPGDGISTTAVSNYTGEQPDYLLVADEYSNIVSRWYVIDAVRVVGGQFKLSLLRDLVADFYYAATSAISFIDRAQPLSINDPAIFNTEDMTFNQIRQQPQLLYDKSKTPWIVGYIPRNSFVSDLTIKSQEYTQVQPDIQVEDISLWQHIDATGAYTYGTQERTKLLVKGNFQTSIDYVGLTRRRAVDEFYVDVNADAQQAQQRRIQAVWKQDNTHFVVPGTQYSNPNKLLQFNSKYPDKPRLFLFERVTVSRTNAYFFQPSAASLAPYMIRAVKSQSGYQTRLNQMHDRICSDIYFDTRKVSTLKGLNGKVIKDTTSGKTYLISLEQTPQTRDLHFSNQPNNQLLSIVKNTFVQSNDPFQELIVTGANTSNWSCWGVPRDEDVKLQVDFIKYRLVLTQTYIKTKVQIKSTTNRQHLTDAPYDMFCIPYGRMNLRISEDQYIESMPGIGLNLAVSIATQAGSGHVYDIQLLPYCPIQNALLQQGWLDLSKTNYQLILTDDEDKFPIGAIIWSSTSNFSFSIPKRIIPSTQLYQKKVNSLTKFCRLCSPNGSGMFEFTPEKNGGLQEIEVNCTYKPFQPYIHLKPRFGVLYGESSSIDYRGLICGGDFSIAQLSNAWANYQQNNANYQAIFDRQIQNMQVTQNVQRSKEVLSGITSTVSGAMSGATSGGAWGAVAGGVTSAAMAGVNYAMNQKLRDQAIDYSTAMFEYNLGNIKAIPNSISKTAANVVNNPLIPYLERYVCTTEEQEALRNYLQYRGFRIDRMGTISEYQKSSPTYIKATPIQIPDIAEGYHIANALAAELTKGVYI